jgi:large subunit ribosomal protein L4
MPVTSNPLLSRHSPCRRGGGVVHGPVPRSHAHSLQKRVRRLGLQCALSAKVWERRLVLVDTLRPAEGKTVRAAAFACACRSY